MSPSISEMGRRFRCTAAPLVLALASVVALAGCGGSGSHSTSAVKHPATVSTATHATTPTASIPATTTTSPTGGAGLSATTSAPTPPAGGGGSTNARVPASFSIGRGGSLTPPTVSSPAFIAVRVSVTTTDGTAHTVLIETPQPHTLHVLPGHKATVLISGLKVGTYRIEVDGTPRGALDIGGDAGP